MSNARIGKQTKSPYAGITHNGTITLSSGQAFSKEEVKKDPAKIIAGIIQQQRTLFSKQIEHLIFARANAENPIYPIRSMLYDIYDDTMIDAFLWGLIYNHRILPVKNKAFKIKNKSGVPDEEKAKLFQGSWFRDFIKFSMESPFYGHSLPYFEELEYDGKTSWIKKVTLVPRKHVTPEKHIYMKYQSDLYGTDYTQPPVSNFVLPVGDPKDLGLLLKASYLVILKKHGWNNWDAFAERFGLPIITVKTASQDARVQGEIQTWLETLSTGAYGIFPTDTEIDIKENKKTDAFQVFMELIDKVNEELAILINGQTMTSMNGSSRSQGEVHERVKDEITKDDEIFIATVINEQLIPLLRDVHNYPFEDGDCFEWDQPEDLQALLNIFVGVNNMGFQIDPVQVEEKFGTKIIGLKQPTPAKPAAGETPDDDQDPENEDEEQPEKPDKSKKPKKGHKVTPEPGEEEFAVRDLIKLHGAIIKLYGGSHVH